jgi:hypothetical protein
MSYDRPNREKYSFRFDAGNNGNETFVIHGPKGKAGRLWNYGVEGVTEAFTADCTVSVGTASDADAYGDEFPMGALLIDTSRTVRSVYSEHDAGFETYMVARDIPKDTPVHLVIVDDTTTGIGNFCCVIDWAD